MTPDELREWALALWVADVDARPALGAADAWQADLDNWLAEVRRIIASSTAVEASLRKRLEEAERELALHEGKEVDSRMMFHLCDNCSGAVDEKLGEIRNGLRKQLEEATQRQLEAWVLANELVAALAKEEK